MQWFKRTIYSDFTVERCALSMINCLEEMKEKNSYKTSDGNKNSINIP